MWTAEQIQFEPFPMALQLIRTARSLDHVGDFRHLMLQFLMEVVEPFLALPAQALVQWRFTRKSFTPELVFSDFVECKARAFHRSATPFQMRDLEITASARDVVAADVKKLKAMFKDGSRRFDGGRDALAKFLGSRLTPDLVFEMLKRLRYDANTALFLFKWAEDQAGYEHETRHFDFIVQVLASAKRFEDLDYVISLVQTKNRQLGFEASQALVVAYANAGLVHKALNILSQLRSQRFLLPAHVLNCIFSALEKLQQHQQAYQITQELVESGWIPRESTSEILLRMWVRQGGLDKAVWLLQLLAQERSQVHPMAFSMVLDSLCKVGKEDTALRLFEDLVVASSLEDGDRDFVCSSLVCGIFRTGKLDRVSYIIRQLIQGGLVWRCSVFAFPGGGKPYSFTDVIEMIQSVGFMSTFAYNCVIEGLCKASKLEEAQVVLGIMQQNRVPPDAFTYSNIIDGICKSGNVEEAEKLLDVLEKSDHKPDVVTYTNMVVGFCQAGRLEHASSTLIRMKEHGCTPDLVTFNTIVSGFCKALEFQEALRVVMEMIDTECEPDEVIYSTIIDAFCRQEEWTSALKVFELMRLRQCPASVDVYGRLAHCLCEAGDVDAALSLLRDMSTGASKSGLVLGGEPCKPNLVVYNTVIGGLCDKGRVQEAFLVLKAMKEEERLEPDVFTYTSLILGFCKTWKMEEAFSILDTMVEAGCEPDATTYNTLILGLRTVGREEEACGMLQVMLEKGCEPDEFTFKVLIETLCKTRKLDAAVHLLGYMKLMRFFPEMATFKNLIYGHYRAGKVKEAKQILQQESKAFSERSPGKSLVSELHEASNPSERVQLDEILRDGL